MTRRHFAREAITRYVTRRDIEQPPPFAAPKDIAAFLTPILAPELIEVSIVLTLNTKHRLIAFHTISRGTVDGVSMHPRDIFRAAIVDNACAIVIAHNHPSGDSTPSKDDNDVTRRMVQTADVVGIDLLDHLIICESKYFSFREAGRL